MWKRNQSMMAEISKCSFINKVIFVNPLGSIRGVFSQDKFSPDSSSGFVKKLLPVKITPKMQIYTPINILPYKKYLAVLKKIESVIMLKVLMQLNSEFPYILFMNCPNILTRDLLDKLLNNAKLSIFDFSDDFVELSYGNNSMELFRQNITNYAQAADIVLTVNEHLRDKYSNLNTNIHVLRNATNYHNFDRKNYNPVEFLEDIKRSNKPIIGYSGIANTSRIDTELLDYLLKKRTDWQFVFIGPTDKRFSERYARFSNIHHIPTVDYQRLPDYIHYFDAAIVPFKINEHTKGNDLLKLHDYLAMGKSVISTNIGGAGDLKDVVSIAGNNEEFLGCIETALKGDNKEAVMKRREVAMENSWQKRIGQVTDLIKNGLEKRNGVIK